MVKTKEKKLRPILVSYFNIFLQLALFVIFMVFFGIPSITKYLDQETMVISSEEETNGIEAPAITFLAYKDQMGWKSWNSKPAYLFKMFDHCKEIGLTHVEACAVNDTYGLADFLKEVKTRDPIWSPSLLNESSTSSLWTEDITTTQYGRHFTLKLHRTITRKTSDMFKFWVDTTSSFFYAIWVHDADFFLINMNPFRKKGCENARVLSMPTLCFSPILTICFWLFSQKITKTPLSILKDVTI